MKKTWTWSTTSGVFTGMKSHEEIRQLCRGAGLSGIEGTTELFSAQSEGELSAIGAGYRDAGLEIRTFHLPAGSGEDLASFYETARRQAVERIRRWMERAALLGVRVGIQHPSSNHYNTEVEGLDKYLGQLEKSLKALLPVAESLGMVIALENMLPGPAGNRLGSRPEHFGHFTRAFAHPNIGFCLDTGHALVATGKAERVDEFFQAMGPRLVAFHLADNAGDRDSHLAPGHGLVDWGRVFRQAAELGFAQSMCIETPPFAPGPDYSDAAWGQMVAEAEVLAEKALAAKSGRK